MTEPIDLREALNAVSDVIQNRPRPLRMFDQIYMRAADMVLQSEYVARWASGGRLAFVGDGDAISVCAAYLVRRNILPRGPSEIVVLDFDERIVSAVNRFADAERIEGLSATLYNCLDPVPALGTFDYFYTNPPWGATNSGESVKVFLQRGIELIGGHGEGLVVIADRDDALPWTEEVLAATQQFGLEQGFYVAKMTQALHSYHLDDNPELRSCNLQLRSLPTNSKPLASEAISSAERLEHFYGADKAPRVQYVRERKRVDYGRAHDDEYELELLEE